MKKIIEAVKEKTWIHYILIMIIGFLVAIPFLWVQLRETDDGYIHVLRMISSSLSFEHGSFPFLLTPFFCRNFGYTMTAFYPPIVTYIPYLLGVLTNSFAIGLKLFSAATIGLSGIFMYNCIYEVTKKKGISFLSAGIYMIFPYRLEVLFDRFAIGEFTALVFVPLVFQGLYNLLHGNKKKHFYITIGAVGLILSHTITTVFTALFCMIYILFHWKDFFKKDVIIKCLINIIFILLITAFVTIPILEFESQAHYIIFDEERMRTSGEWVAQNTLDPIQFVKDLEEDGVSFVLGIPTVVMLAIGVLAYRNINEKDKDFYVVNLILGMVCMWMCTKFFPWSIMPRILTNIQYPWRLIGLSMFFLVPVMAMNVYYLICLIKKEKIKAVTYGFIIFLLGVFTILELRVYPITDRTLDEKYEQKIKGNPVISYMSMNREYLPYNAATNRFEYLSKREDKVYVLEGNANIENEEKYGLRMSFNLIHADESTILELPFLFYPGYTVKIYQDEKIYTLPTIESEHGFLQITVPEEVKRASVKVEYTGTNIEKLAYAVTIGTTIAFVGYMIYSEKKTKVKEKNENKN